MDAAARATGNQPTRVTEMQLHHHAGQGTAIAVLWPASLLEGVCACGPAPLSWHVIGTTPWHE